MARGQEEKNQISQKILEMFPGAFEYDKAIRIPIGDVEIKVALTCAKDNVAGDMKVSTTSSDNFPAPDGSKELAIPTEEELTQVKNLIETLGL